MHERRVVLGEIVGAQGIRGAVRIRSFTADPAAIADYGPLTDAKGERTFRLKVTGMTRGNVVATIAGIADRNAAEALRGVRLCIAREALPDAGDDEFYQEDLIGLAVETADGARLGTVRAVVNYGAGDMLEVDRGRGATVLLPFTREAVPTVDVAGGRVVAAPPAGLFDPAEGEADG
ncbi:MAG: ribosome maturation factor RimM [Rhodospirillales bacterium]